MDTPRRGAFFLFCPFPRGKPPQTKPKRTALFVVAPPAPKRHGRVLSAVEKRYGHSEERPRGGRPSLANSQETGSFACPSSAWASPALSSVSSANSLIGPAAKPVAGHGEVGTAIGSSVPDHAVGEVLAKVGRLLLLLLRRWLIFSAFLPLTCSRPPKLCCERFYFAFAKVYTRTAVSCAVLCSTHPFALDSVVCMHIRRDTPLEVAGRGCWLRHRAHDGDFTAEPGYSCPPHTCGVKV